MSIIGGVIDRLVVKGILIRQKIYDIDANRFFQDFYRDDYFCWEEAFDSVQDQYMAIRLEQKQLDEYRTMRRKNRSRWVGWGVGIGCAIKGAAKAGAMNMASGALHGLFNAGAKVLSMADESLQKSSLYKSSSTKDTLIGAIYASVFGIHLAVWDMTEQRNGKMRVECLEPGADKQAAAIVNNFAGMSKDEIRRMLPRVMLMNPYDENLYRELFSIFGDSDGGLQKAARYFGEDTSFITEEKEALAGKIFEDIRQELGQSEQSALNAKRKYELALKSHGVGDTLSAQKNLKVIEGVLSDYDTKARTVDGKIFRTRDEADEARRSGEEFERSIKACDYKSSEENARKAMEIIMSYDAKTDAARKRAESKREKIGKILVDFDVKARTAESGVGEMIFDTREEAVSAREEIAKIDSLLDGINYKRSEDDARKALEKLEGYTPGFRKVYSVYLDKVKEILSAFNTEASTVDFCGLSVVIDREDAERLKASQKLNDIAVSWENYKTERTDGALGHIAELIQKMPVKIRESFWGLMNDFESEQRKEVSETKSGMSLKSILCYVITVAGLAFFVLHWQEWEWEGLKGLAAAVLFVLPIVAGMVNENASGLGAAQPTFYCWGVSILAITIRSWSSYSTGWKILAVVAVIGIMLLIIGSTVAIADAKKATEYIKDFEVLSSQSEEYKAFKETNTK